MPAKEQRKIMRHGTSGVVAIPKPYRNYYGLEPGSTVIILYDSMLLIVPKSREKLLKEKAQLISQLLGEAK
ncbi:MAG: AbrB/MazE/SpoVT family DNA-binding domain-containing protein [Candidatus Bathyarchaeales archaeon]